MIKLLRANLARISKSATFWIFFSLYFIFSIVWPIAVNGIEPEFASEYGVDCALAYGYGVLGVPIQGIIIAILCCVILGLEFHNNTIRNKLILGHTKGQIYIANLLTMNVVSLAFSAVYLLFFFTISMPLFGKFTLPAKDVFILFIDGTLMMLAYSAVYTCVTMTSKNTIVAILVTFVLMFVSIYLVDFALVDVDKDSGISQATKDFSQFLMDFLPSGQSYQLSNNNAYRWQMSLCSLSLIALSSGVGITIFKRSSIK